MTLTHEVISLFVTIAIFALAFLAGSVLLRINVEWALLGSAFVAYLLGYAEGSIKYGRKYA